MKRDNTYQSTKRTFWAAAAGFLIFLLGACNRAVMDIVLADQVVADTVVFGRSSYEWIRIPFWT